MWIRPWIQSWKSSLFVAVLLVGTVVLGGFPTSTAQDIEQTITSAKPVLRGKYRGKEIAFPMRKAERCPDFDAFLVMPKY